MEHRTIGQWTVRESGELTHRNCDRGVRLLGRRMVCNQCLAVVPQSIRQLADEVQHLAGDVNMTVQEPVEETLEDVTETLEEELAYEAGDLDEQIEAEAVAQEEDDVETTEETSEVLETEEAEVTSSVPVTAAPGQRIINVLR